jgi:hypothetical protein
MRNHDIAGFHETTSSEIIPKTLPQPEYISWIATADKHASGVATSDSLPGADEIDMAQSAQARFSNSIVMDRYPVKQENWTAACALPSNQHR